MTVYEQLFVEKGKYRFDERYTEILKLDEMLTDANIPHTLERCLDGWQIIYPDDKNIVADAIQHYGSYGNQDNLLEIMGLIKPEETSDTVLGYLTAEDVFTRMSEHYKAHSPEVVEVKRGEWDCVNEDENVYMCAGENGCGFEIILNDGTPKENDFVFCPNCGAKMDGGK